jgi:hypothetical protein
LLVKSAFSSESKKEELSWNTDNNINVKNGTTVRKEVNLNEDLEHAASFVSKPTSLVPYVYVGMPMAAGAERVSISIGLCFVTDGLCLPLWVSGTAAVHFLFSFF